MAEGGPVLELDRLSKRFGGLAVTRDVSFTVERGEVHALIGPNGAGKTTLINQISGALAPDAGAIRLEGRDVTRWPVHARARAGLARSFQITSVIPSFTARANVAMAAQALDGSSFRLFGRVDAEPGLNRAALGALAEVGLADRAEAPAGSLSHGEKRGLELAMALAMRPRVLLLDEPMAGTGHDESARLVERLKEIKGRVAMVLVEHDMDAVFALADRVSVLVDGAIIASGLPAAVRADPAVRRAYTGES